MTVAELIVWLQAQPQDAQVDIGMNQEYQDPLCPETCQLTEYEGVQYVLLGEEVYSEDDGQPDEAQEWVDFDPDC